MIQFYKKILVYMRDWEATLSWALDMVEMYENRLSEIDGEEMVRPQEQKDAFKVARNRHFTLKKVISNLEEEIGTQTN